MKYVDDVTGDVAVSADIIKYEKQDDGTVLVYGKATDDTLDIDRQIADPEWLGRAMPEWFRSAGNIRDMHQSSAAGKAVEYEQKGNEHFIKALVVDPVAAKKVEHGVYTGFSIGIRGPRIVQDTKAANGRIIDGQIVEVSLVDRPANPAAKFVMAKSVDGELMKVEEMVDTERESKEILEPDTANAPTFEQVEPVLAEVKSADAGNTAVEPEILKYDADAYEAACKAITDLIAVEAKEAAEGEDESDSIKHLMKALKHLRKWKVGEIEEGEAPATDPEASDADLEDDDDKGDALEQIADVLGMAADADVTKNATIDPVEETSQTSVEAGEVAALKAALQAATERATGLETQLNEALNKVAIGGPKRTGRTSSNSLNDIQVKAAILMQKAAATSDPILQQGYRERAEELLKDLSRKENANG